MTKPILILFIFLCSLFLGTTAQYEYFQMVQQWPLAKCSEFRGPPCTVTAPRVFTIHGLWPSNYTNVLLVCQKGTFVKFQKPLERQLNISWPNLTGDNAGFWSYEWTKHGICSDPPFNQVQYFQKTLDMHTNTNLLAILNAVGFGPTIPISSVLHKYSDIEGAIAATTGKKPGLRCNINATTRRNQLFEVILCFDHSGATLIDCPRTAGIKCPSQFLW